jgi:hypothetical protein
MNQAVDNPPADPSSTLPQSVEDPVEYRAIVPVPYPGSDDNPYLGDFSRRVAERLARLPERADRDFDDGEDGGLTWKVLARSYKLVLTIMVGAVLYGATVYPLLSELRPAGASARPLAQPGQ